MKKLFILATMVAMLAACGNKAVTEEQVAADTTIVDTTVVVEDEAPEVVDVDTVEAEVAE